jgi:hypothetical protein
LGSRLIEKCRTCSPKPLLRTVPADYASVVEEFLTARRAMPHKPVTLPT